jgi:D-glycero-alpha-D-manno-heptose-7-phosphate kinase
MTHSAPARIDLAGGTLDVPPLHFLIRDSLTLNIAIDLRVAVAVDFQGNGHVHIDGDAFPIKDIPIFALALEAFDAGNASIHISSNIPKASGLGGSSSLVVALIRELGASENHILGDVTVIEHRLLGKPAGTQDALAAIHGGAGKITFPHGNPMREPLPCPSFLSGPIFLAYSSVQHHSRINNWAIIKAACEGDIELLTTLDALKENAHAMLNALASDDSGSFLDCLHREVRLRTELCPSIRTPAMEQFANHFDERLACKVCGAGGGGGMFLFGEELDPEELHWAGERHGLRIIETRVDKDGCREDGP